MLAHALPECHCRHSDKPWRRRGVTMYMLAGARFLFQPYICDACARIAAIVVHDGETLFCVAHDIHVRRSGNEQEQCATFLRDFSSLMSRRDSGSGIIPLHTVTLYSYAKDRKAWERLDFRR